VLFINDCFRDVRTYGLVWRLYSDWAAEGIDGV